MDSFEFTHLFHKLTREEKNVWAKKWLDYFHNETTALNEFQQQMIDKYGTNEKQIGGLNYEARGL